MTSLSLAGGVLAVDDDIRAEATSFRAEAHDREVDGVRIELDDGSELELPSRLSTFIVNIVESIAADGTISTTSLPEELTTTVAAELLGISRPTLMKMIERDELPSKKVGTHTRLRRDDVFLLRQQRQEARVAAVHAVRSAGEAFD